jgi:hypothetical protein
VQEIPHEVIKSTPNPKTTPQDQERSRVIEHIEKSTTLDQLKRCEIAIQPDDEELMLMYDDKT